jgi:predicted transcriptional regulator
MKTNRKKMEIALARACMTAADISERAEMPRPTVNNVLGGRSCRPATIGRVAKALGVSIEDLIEEDDDG